MGPLGRKGISCRRRQESQHMGKMSTHDWSILHGRAEAGEDIEARWYKALSLPFFPVAMECF